MNILKKLFYKKKFIIFSLTAILTLLIIPNSVKALSIPTGYTDNYTVLYNETALNLHNYGYYNYFIIFSNSNRSSIYTANTLSCSSTDNNSYNISRFWSILSNQSTPKFKAILGSTDGENWTMISNNGSFNWGDFNCDTTVIKSTIDIVNRGDNSIVYYPAGYEYQEIPDYLTGYQKVTLRGLSYNEDHYYVISGISQGSFYVPYEYVLNYDSSFSYVNENWESIPWSARVIDYYIMEDELYVRYDFNLNDFPDAQFIQYDKMGNFFQGTDFPEVDIYVPSTSYGSLVTVTPNSSGGNDFSYSWKDEQDNIISTTNEYIPVNNNPLLPDFLKDFSTDTFGLTSIITSPLNVISNITNTTCTEIQIPIPYVDKNITLPCMSNIYSSTFGEAFTLYQTLSFGFVAYWVIVRILNLVKDFKNPDHDEIEVVDL